MFKRIASLIIGFGVVVSSGVCAYGDLTFKNNVANVPFEVNKFMMVESLPIENTLSDKGFEFKIGRPVSSTTLDAKDFIVDDIEILRSGKSSTQFNTLYNLGGRRTVTRGSKRVDYVADLSAFYRMVEAEMTSGNFEQKADVAQAIVNRAKHDAFPSTLKGVCFDKQGGKRYQFDPLNDKRYYKVEVTQETIDACMYVLNLEKPLHKGIFFQAKGCDNKWFRTLTKVKFDGGHSFYIN